MTVHIDIFKFKISSVFFETIKVNYNYLKLIKITIKFIAFKLKVVTLANNNFKKLKFW